MKTNCCFVYLSVVVVDAWKVVQLGMDIDRFQSKGPLAVLTGHQIHPLKTKTNNNTHTHIHTYTYVHTYIHTYIHIHTYTYIHTYIHTYVHTYIHVSVAEWLAWLTSNCGRIGAIGSSPSNGLIPNKWGQKGFNPLCQCVYIYVCIVKPDIQTIHRCSHGSRSILVCRLAKCNITHNKQTNKQTNKQSQQPTDTEQ